MRERADLLKCMGYKIYPAGKHLCFALTDSMTLMLTPSDTMVIEGSQRNSRAGLARVRRSIIRKRYKTVADVWTDMRLQPGVGVSYRSINFRWLVEGLEPTREMK